MKITKRLGAAAAPREKKSSSKKSRKEEVVDGKEEENNSGGEENEDNEEVGGGAEGEELATEEEFDSDEYTSDSDSDEYSDLETSEEEALLEEAKSECAPAETTNGVKRKKNAIIESDDDQEVNEVKVEDTKNEKSSSVNINDEIIKNKENKLVSDKVMAPGAASSTMVNAKKRKNDLNEIINTSANPVAAHNQQTVLCNEEYLNNKKVKIDSTTTSNNPMTQQPQKPNVQPQGVKLANINNTNQQASQSTKEIECINIVDSSSSESSIDTRQQQNPTLALNVQSPALAKRIHAFIDTFNTRVKLSQRIWTDDVKDDLLRIYEEYCLMNKSDRCQIFNYVSAKINMQKDSLLRNCRKLKAQREQQRQQQQQSNNIISSSPNKSALMNSSMSPSKAQASPSTTTMSNQLTLNDLSAELKSKIINLRNEFQTFKQAAAASNTTNNSVVDLDKFFQSQKVQSIIISIENLIKSGKGDAANSILSSSQLSENAKIQKIREFLYLYFANVCQSKRAIIHTKYQHILNLQRIRASENIIRGKSGQLRLEIEAQMPKNNEKYEKAMEEFNNRNKDNPEGAKKANPPRRRFEMTDKIRELITDIIKAKMSLYKPANQSTPGMPQQSPSLTNTEANSQEEQMRRAQFIDSFFEQDMINLWPKNWMQKNVLQTIYQTKYVQPLMSLQKQQHLQRATSSQSATTFVAPNANNNGPRQMSSSNLSSLNTTPKLASSQTSSSSLSQLQTSQAGNSSGTSNNSASIINVSSKSGKPIKIEHQMSTNNSMTANKSHIMSTPSTSNNASSSSYPNITHSSPLNNSLNNFNKANQSANAGLAKSPQVSSHNQNIQQQHLNSYEIADKIKKSLPTANKANMQPHHFAQDSVALQQQLAQFSLPFQTYATSQSSPSSQNQNGSSGLYSRHTNN